MSAATAKGRARQEAIAGAAGDLLLQRGLAAVSHRVVAERAGVPLGSTTYYFASLAELRAAAVHAAAEVETARARGALDASPSGTGLARRLLDAVVGLERLGDPAVASGTYERILEASRVPEVRQASQAWQRAFTALVTDALARHGMAGIDAGLVLAVIDGRTIAWLADGAGDPAALVDTLARDLAHLGVIP